jgi:hypothetical protein
MGAKTNTINPYMRNFQQSLIDGGIYTCLYDDGTGPPPKPANWDAIKARISRRRPSLDGFSEERFHEFVRVEMRAKKEKEFMEYVIPTIRGQIGNPDCTAGKIRFQNLEALIEHPLASGCPDLYYGSLPATVNKRVRDCLNTKSHQQLSKTCPSHRTSSSLRKDRMQVQ